MKYNSRKTISSKTDMFAVLGHPIGHTLSPSMHNSAFEALGMDALYLAFDVPPERLMETLGVMAEIGFNGINLTVPLKEEAFKGIANLSDSARVFRSVNTVKIVAGSLEGHSTDGEGFVHGVKEAFNISLSGVSVFVLGCGGAGRAVALAAASEGASRICLTDLDMSRSENLQAEISRISEGQVCSVPAELGKWVDASLESDLVVQATPIGMREKEKPLLISNAFRPGQLVYDLIYMFPETRFMKEAREAGALVANGLDMLLFQGALAFSIWTEKEAPIEVMRSVLKEAVYGKK